MKFCTNCGNQIDPNAYVCPKCGVQVAQQPQQPMGAPVQNQTQADSGSFGWAVLGFFIPLVGLILFLCWKSTKPNSAKKAGIGALVGFCVNVVLTIIGNAALWSSLS